MSNKKFFEIDYLRQTKMVDFLETKDVLASSKEIAEYHKELNKVFMKDIFASSYIVDEKEFFEKVREEATQYLNKIHYFIVKHHVRLLTIFQFGYFNKKKKMAFVLIPEFDMFPNKKACFLQHTFYELDKLKPKEWTFDFRSNIGGYVLYFIVAFTQFLPKCKFDFVYDNDIENVKLEKIYISIG